MTAHGAEAEMSRRLSSLTLILAAVASGCTFINQIEYEAEHSTISLGPEDLAGGGIGFLTPSAATTHEADKQPLAMSFAHKLEEMYPDVTVVPLPNVLSAMNSADLDGEYKQMYRDYLETGILEGSILKRISEVADVRYFAQLSLSAFRQSNAGRFSILGLRISHTEVANMRVFVQIWDAHNADVAWEGFTELNYAYETAGQKPVTFADVSEMAAERMFAELPGYEEK